jgi:hypothetical protein
MNGKRKGKGEKPAPEASVGPRGPEFMATRLRRGGSTPRTGQQWARVEASGTGLSAPLEPAAKLNPLQASRRVVEERPTRLRCQEE